MRDLAFFPIDQLDTTAINYAIEMLQKAKEKYPDNQVKFFHMDAQNLQFENQSFDTVVASLILSVVPNPQKL